MTEDIIKRRAQWLRDITQAYLNAFVARDGNEPGSFLNLTERRTEYHRENPTVFYRTLIRHETEGAELIARYADAAIQLLKGRIVKPDPGEGLEIDVEALRQRVADLEQVLGLVFDAGLQRLGLLQKLR